MGQEPFLRWAGSKRKLLPKLMPYWEASGCSRYIEPFAGSAVMYFAIKPQRAVLADTNKDLIDMYLVMQRNCHAVYNEITQYPCSESFYYQLRDADYKSWSACRRAARFIYLNRFCFNGLYRTNNKGHFNVPFARGVNRKLQSLEAFKRFSKAIKGVGFYCQDFRRTLLMAEKDDFIYADPPYAIENRRIFNQYGPSSFGSNDLMDLANMLTMLHEKGVKFLVSYAYAKEFSVMFDKWNLKSTIVQRTVAGNPRNRKRVKELFISNIKI